MASADAPPALATTKRKFHKLLDSLTASTSTASLASTLPASNASTTSLELAGSPEPATKRPRSAHISEERQRNISAGQERIRVLKEQLLTPQRNATVRVVGQPAVQPTPKLSPSPSTATSPRQAPNYQPYSQEQFLARLKTFAQVKKWTSKPDEIGEVAWARRGWSCDAWNTVACKGGCEKRVVVKLRPRREDAAGQGIEMSEDLAVDVDAALVRTYRDLIVTAHADDCLWRKKGCQDDIYHIPIANRSKSTADLLARYASFLPLSADLPLLSNISYPPPSTPNILSHLPRAFFSPHPPPTSPTDTVAFTFALFGWSGITDSRISLATCSHCFQRLGLWLSSDTRLREMSSKLDVSMQSLRLNLLEAHREHCPWKNGEVQGNSIDGPIAGMSAWQTLQFILLAGRDAVTSRSSARDKDTTRDKDLPPTPTRPGHRRAADSVDVASESGSVYPRGSMESGERPALEDDEDEGLQNKWKKLKAKLKRTASKKSLRSVKSGKSGKSFGKDK